MSKSFLELLAACKQLSPLSFFTAAHYPPIDDGTTGPVEEYWIDCQGRGEEVVAQLAALGYKPVGIKRAMEYVADHLDAQLDHDLAVVGAQWLDEHDCMRIPIFCGTGSYRHIDFDWLHGDRFQRPVCILVARPR